MHRLSFAASQQIRRTCRHRGSKARGVPDEGNTTVVWDIEPFMRIGRPRVRQLQSLNQRSPRRFNAGPEPKRSVDMDPCACVMRNLADVLKWVARSGIDVSG